LRAVPAQDGGVEADLEAMAYVIARAFAEVLAGLRPLHHVAGRATPEVYDLLAAALPAMVAVNAAGRRTVPPLRVGPPRVQEPAPGVAEVCAVVFTGTRAQALALRLEHHRGRWRCSAVETTLAPRQQVNPTCHLRGKSA